MARSVEDIAIHIAIEAPTKRAKYAVSAAIPWELIDELRAALRERGYVVDDILRMRDQIVRERRAER